MSYEELYCIIDENVENSELEILTCDGNVIIFENVFYRECYQETRSAFQLPEGVPATYEGLFAFMGVMVAIIRTVILCIKKK